MSKLTRCPLTLPVLPLTNSGTSGFFFWGIMLDPVQKLSEISIKLKNGLDHITNSSDHLERWVIKSDEFALNSIKKSLSDTASIEFSMTPSKSNNLATNLLSIG